MKRMLTLCVVLLSVFGFTTVYANSSKPVKTPEPVKEGSSKSPKDTKSTPDAYENDESKLDELQEDFHAQDEIGTQRSNHGKR